MVWDVWAANSLKGRLATLGKIKNFSYEQEFQFFTGSLAPDADLPGISFAVTGGQIMPEVFQTQTKILVVSAKVRQLLDGLGDVGLRFFPCQVGERSDYFLVYGHNLISPLNLKRSQLSYSLKHPGLLRSCGPVFDLKKIPSAELTTFRIAEFPYYLWVSPKLAQIVSQANLLGSKFPSYVQLDPCHFVDLY